MSLHTLPPRLGAILFLSLALCGRVQAGDIVHDNGVPNRFNAKEMTLRVQADDFTLADRTRLSSVKFWDFEVPGGFAGSISWKIYANAADNKPGSLLFEGTSTNLVHTDTGFTIWGPFREFVTTFDFDSTVVLPAGRYWLALHNGPETYTTADNFYWAATNLGSSAPSHYRLAGTEGPWGSNEFPGYPHELAFQIRGTPQPISAPMVESFTIEEGVPTIKFSTSPGETYHAEYKNSLTADWIVLPNSEITGTGGLGIIRDLDPQIATVPRRFYRVFQQ